LQAHWQAEIALHTAQQQHVLLVLVLLLLLLNCGWVTAALGQHCDRQL
jgi:hypothetical protein